MTDMRKAGFFSWEKACFCVILETRQGGREMNTPVTKKTIGKRLGFWYKCLIVVVFILGFGRDLLFARDVSSEKRIEIYLGSAATLAGILFVWIYVWFQKQKVLRMIQRQEACLNVDFDADMHGITMENKRIGVIEAVACGDWYILISQEDRLAINRKYILGIKDVYKREKGLRGRIHWQITIAFDTIDHTPLVFRLSDAEQVIIDLCEWLGHPIAEIRED